MRVMLTYFKAHGGGPKNLGGKYYATGEHESRHEPNRYFDAIEEVARMRDERRLPGLVEGHGEYHVLITTEPESVPHLLIAPSFVNPEPTEEKGDENKKPAVVVRRGDPRWFELYKATLGGLCADSSVTSDIAFVAARIADKAYELMIDEDPKESER